MAVLLFVRSVTEEFRTAYGGRGGGRRFSEYIHCDFLTFFPDVRFMLIQTQQISTYQDADIRIVHYSDRLGPLGKIRREIYKINWLKVTGFRIKYSRVLWLIELQIGLGRKVQTQTDVLTYLLHGAESFLRS